MKVSKWVDMGQEVEVEVTTEDIRQAIEESLSSFTNRNEWAGDPPATDADVMRLINECAKVFNAITEEQIATLNDVQRRTVVKYLSDASRKWEKVRLQMRIPA